MNKIAVDVVLLPSDEMTDRAIRANTELVEKFGSEIVLNKKNCLPHISLAMGCINERDVLFFFLVMLFFIKKTTSKYNYSYKNP